jgi:hypothetical protein
MHVPILRLGEGKESRRLLAGQNKVDRPIQPLAVLARSWLMAARKKRHRT